MWSSKVHQCLIVNARRNFSPSAVVNVNHYDVLGITPKATQAEVKAAYYKLSKKHHPDTSGTDDDGGDQFRLITEAYDVLGNHKTRKLYDKGLYGHSRSAERRQDVTPDHPKMSFYKSRFDKSKVPTAKMSNIYNFDEWTRQHYSETFAKSQWKHKTRTKIDPNDNPHEVKGDEVVLKFSVIMIVVVLICFQSMELGSYLHDNPKPVAKALDKPA